MSESGGIPGKVQDNQAVIKRLYDTLKKKAERLQERFLQYAGLFMRIAMNESGVTMTIPYEQIELTVNITFQDVEIYLIVKQLKDHPRHPWSLQRLIEQNLVQSPIKPTPMFSVVDGHEFATIAFFTPSEVLDPNLTWLENNIRYFIQVAMLSTWARDHELFKKVRHGCCNIMERGPQLAQRQEEFTRSRMLHEAVLAQAIEPAQPLLPRVRLADESGADMSSARVVRQRQEEDQPMGAGGGYASPPRPEVQEYEEDGPPQWLAELQEEEQDIIPQAGMVMGVEPVVKVAYRGYPIITALSLTESAGKNAPPPLDGQFPRANCVVREYYREANDRLYNASSTDQAIIDFWKIWDDDKREFAGKTLTKAHMDRIDYLLAGINDRWEKDHSKNAGVSLKTIDIAVFCMQFRTGQTLDDIINNVLFPASRDFQILRESFKRCAKLVLENLKTEYYNKLIQGHQTMLVGFLQDAIDQIRAFLPVKPASEMEYHKESGLYLATDVMFTSQTLSNGVEFKVNFPNLPIILDISATIKRGMDITLDFNGAMTQDEISRLRDAILSGLHRDVPEFEKMDLIINVENRTTKVRVHLLRWTDIQLKIRMLQAILTSFMGQCVIAFLYASHRVLEKGEDYDPLA